MKKLDIILRTQDDFGRQVHVIGTRGMPEGTTKQDIVLRCAESLAAAIKSVDIGVVISLLIIDDHSTQETQKKLIDIFNDINIINFIFLGVRHLIGKGNNKSMVEWYTTAKSSKADAVYLIEDDYLHEINALSESIWAFDEFTNKLGYAPSLFLMDDSDNYFPDWLEPCRVVPGKSILWRTNSITTGTMFVTPKFINENWDPIYEFAYYYGIKPGLSEETLFRPMWTQNTVLFTPLTMLAYHLCGKNHPVYDERPLWESFKVI